MKKVHLATAFIVLAFTFASCTNESNRYVVLQNNEFPTVLDTKTKDVYVIINYADRKPKIFKGNLADRE